MAKGSGGKKGSYKVGYGKPPKHTQFVKGQSGNPKGRPKGMKNAATIFRKACEERIRVMGKKGSKMITKYEAGCIQLANKAAGGDLRAIGEMILGYAAAGEQQKFFNPPSLIINFVDPPNRTEELLPSPRPEKPPKLGDE